MVFIHSQRLPNCIYYAFIRNYHQWFVVLSVYYSYLLFFSIILLCSHEDWPVFVTIQNVCIHHALSLHCTPTLINLQWDAPLNPANVPLPHPINYWYLYYYTCTICTWAHLNPVISPYLNIHVNSWRVCANSRYITWVGYYDVSISAINQHIVQPPRDSRTQQQTQCITTMV